MMMKRQIIAFKTNPYFDLTYFALTMTMLTKERIDDAVASSSSLNSCFPVSCLVLTDSWIRADCFSAAHSSSERKGKFYVENAHFSPSIISVQNTSILFCSCLILVRGSHSCSERRSEERIHIFVQCFRDILSWFSSWYSNHSSAKEKKG